MLVLKTSQNLEQLPIVYWNHWEFLALLKNSLFLPCGSFIMASCTKHNHCFGRWWGVGSCMAKLNTERQSHNWYFWCLNSWQAQWHNQSSYSITILCRVILPKSLSKSWSTMMTKLTLSNSGSFQILDHFRHIFREREIFAAANPSVVLWILRPHNHTAWETCCSKLGHAVAGTLRHQSD